MVVFLRDNGCPEPTMRATNWVAGKAKISEARQEAVRKGTILILRDADAPVTEQVSFRAQK